MERGGVAIKKKKSISLQLLNFLLTELNQYYNSLQTDNTY